MEELIKQIESRKVDFKIDSYTMSIGELYNMYLDEEIVINPDFQRFYRWTKTQKSRFIESVLLGIPIPGIFVYQSKESNQWEIVDGLQRVSTILQFMGVLQKPASDKDDADDIANYEDSETIDNKYDPLVLEKTKYLPALDGVCWNKKNTKEKELDDKLKIGFKRSKISITIILPESEANVKYEVFQRLNTGGSFATPQELRNCISIMLNKNINNVIKKMAKNDDFLSTINLNERLLAEQYQYELVLKYIRCVFDEYDGTKDVRDNLDEINESLSMGKFDNKIEQIKNNFDKTFKYLNELLQENAFKKYNFSKGNFEGRFLESAYELVAIGIGRAFLEGKYLEGKDEKIKELIKNLWKNEEFLSKIGTGTNARKRISEILEFSKKYFMEVGN